MSRKRHPLLNPDAAHYYDADGKTTIEKLEAQLTVCQMIGACKFNIEKYTERAERKGQREKDLAKAQDYKRYLEALLALPMAVYEAKVINAWAAVKIKWEYKV